MIYYPGLKGYQGAFQAGVHSRACHKPEAGWCGLWSPQGNAAHRPCPCFFSRQHGFPGRERPHPKIKLCLPHLQPGFLTGLRPALSIQPQIHFVGPSPISGPVGQGVMGDFCLGTSVPPVLSRLCRGQDSASPCPGGLGTILCLSSWYQALAMFSCCLKETLASWRSPSEVQPGPS